MESLKKRLETNERSFKENGSYLKIPRLIREDRLRFEEFHDHILSCLAGAREVARRVSASPMVSEVGELCFALLSPDGDCVAVSTGITAHVHTFGRIVKWMIENDYEDLVGIREGDFFANNDGFIGGIHTPDIADVTPIFYEDELVGWIGSLTHVLEVGGVDPGSMPPSASSRFHDGVYICCEKVAERDELRRDYEIRMERNTRSGKWWLLDERARITGCCQIRDEVKKIISEYGRDFYIEAVIEIIEMSRRNFLEKARLMCIPGRYRAVSFYDIPWAEQPVDTNAAVDTILHLPVEVVIDGYGKISISFEGTSPCGFHSQNCTPSGVEGAFALAAAQTIAYDLPINDGIFQAVEMFIPEGSVLFPDSIHVSICCSWMTLMPCFGGIFRILSRAFYARGYREEILCAVPNTGAMQTGGTDQYGSSFGAMISELCCCGSGARGVTDGIDCAYAMWNHEPDMGNIEVWESIIPQIYLGRRVCPDSGGFGKFRGGNSFESLWLVHHSDRVLINTFAHGSRVYSSPGIMGGYPAMCNYNHLAHQTNVRELILKQMPLPHDEGPDPSHPVMEQLVKAKKVVIGADGVLMSTIFKKYDLFEHMYQASGGYGDPLQREPKRIEDDIKDGHTRISTAKNIYGIAWDQSNGKVDGKQTEILRQKLKEDRAKKAIPAADYKAEQRFRILSGDLSDCVKEMYEQCFRLSPKFKKEFTSFWHLPEAFRFTGMSELARD